MYNGNSILGVSVSGSPAFRERRGPKPNMHYVYILKDAVNHLYIGYSSNLKQRLASHLRGETITTSKMICPKLIYYESYDTEKMARNREIKLKQFGSSYTGLLKRLGLK